MKKLFLILALGSATALVSCDKDKDEEVTLNQTDKEFLNKASMGNHAEIGAGSIAAQRGDMESVRNFGEMMVDDHTTAQAELKVLAGKKNMNVPDDMDEEHKQLGEKLKGLSGKAFDTEYINSQVTDHMKTIELYEKVISNGRDADVKNYAQKFLPKIKMHYDKAKELQDELMNPVP